MPSGLLDIFRPIASVSPYDGNYNPWLVLVSVCVAVPCGVRGPVDLIAHGRGDDQRGPGGLSAAGAFSMGGGIWSMHFIGMLALSLPCGITYNPLGTLLSMIPGVLASGVALALISQTVEPGPRRLLAGGVLMGAGIGAMHYSGMSAVEADALIRYQPGPVLGVWSSSPSPSPGRRSRYATKLRRYWRSDVVSATGDRGNDHGHRRLGHALHRDAGLGVLPGS